MAIGRIVRPGADASAQACRPERAVAATVDQHPHGREPVPQPERDDPDGCVRCPTAGEGGVTRAHTGPGDVRRVGRTARSTRDPSKLTKPAAIFVPPMSTASTRSVTGPALPRSRDPKGRSGPAQRGRAQPRAMLSPRAGGSGSGTSRAPRSLRPRSRSMRCRVSTPRPSFASGRAIRPGPCAAGSVRTRPPRRT